MPIENGTRLSELPEANVTPARVYGIGDNTSLQFTPRQIVDAGRPFATVAQAVAGEALDVSMNPFVTRQAVSQQVASEFGPLVEQATNAADAATLAAAEATAAAAGISSLYTFDSYASALTGAPALPEDILVISADVDGVETRWIRLAGGTALGGGWAPAGTATPFHYGAAGDGVSNDTAAMQACLDAGGRITLPEGRSFRVLSTLVVPAGLTELCVTGPGTILWAGDTAAVNLWGFTNYTRSARLPRAVFKGVRLRGTHDVNRSFIASYPLLVNNVAEVLIDGCEVSYSRVMGIAVRAADRVRTVNCHVHHCARDGINVADCFETITIGNDVHDCDDDAIAVHNQIFAWSRGHVVTGNKIRKAQGIRALGVNNISITGNTLEFYINQGVDVSTYPAGGADIEGVNATFSVVISGNVFSDPINRGGLDALNTGSSGIVINGVSARAGSVARIPGIALDPLPYMGNVRTAATNLTSTPIPLSSGFTISGNIFKRTMPRTGMFSTLGFGLFWMRGGELDYDMGTTDANNAVAIRMANGAIENVRSTGNVYSGFLTFLLVPTFVSTLRGAYFSADLITDIYSTAVSIVSEDRSFDVKFSSCVFDLDPYHNHPNRNATGGWAVQNNGPTGITTGVSRGLSVVDCDFKNMSRLTDEGVFAKTGRMEFVRNRIWSQAAAGGFSTSNGGVGSLETAAMSTGSLVTAIYDPASADYGRVLRRGFIQASALAELTGFYLSGEYVEKIALGIIGTAPNRYVVRGWIRLTSGTAHVLGTDWVEDRMYLGS